MEALLVEQQRQDWSMFEYAGQLVCRDVEGWQVGGATVAGRVGSGLRREGRRHVQLGCVRLLGACPGSRRVHGSCPGANPSESAAPHQAVVSALPVKPMLLREPCPDLLLERFTPGPCGETPRVYPADLARECRVVSVEGGVCL